MTDMNTDIHAVCWYEKFYRYFVS